eukprot:472879-Amorphochlora_amoeboformis.AAC.1
MCPFPIRLAADHRIVTMRYVTRIWPFGVRKEKVDEENGGKKKKKGRYFGWIIKIAAVDSFGTFVVFGRKI